MKRDTVLGLIHDHIDRRISEDGGDNYPDRGGSF